MSLPNVTYQEAFEARWSEIGFTNRMRDSLRETSIKSASRLSKAYLERRNIAASRNKKRLGSTNSSTELLVPRTAALWVITIAKLERGAFHYKMNFRTQLSEKKSKFSWVKRQIHFVIASKLVKWPKLHKTVSEKRKVKWLLINGLVLLRTFL